MNRWLLAGILSVGLVSANGVSAAAATVNVCGALQALQRPNPPQLEGAGLVMIDGKTFRLSSALSNNGTNTIGPSATIGTRVCLSGELVAGTDNLLNNYVLSAGSGPVGSLPSTSTEPSPKGPLSLLLFAVALLGAVLLHQRRKDSSPVSASHYGELD